ncbi:cytochrome P450 [Streptomyces sp. NPDC059788]|uniref:cytochrome P450 n=1 Tax=Streptomyces sp. NPDC059788 TaxID=3346948 RepID=UPI00364ADFC8
MTTPRPDAARDNSAPVPPRGCPAHGMGPEVRRLYGADAEAHPKELYEALRQEHGSVAPVLLHGDVPAWIVLGYQDNLEVMRTPSRFSRDSRRWSAWQEGLIPDDSPLVPMVGWQPLCVFADGAELLRLRSAVTDSLDQLNRHGVRRYIARYTRQLVSAFARKGEADLVRDYAEPLPMLVVSQVLGLAPEEGQALVAPALDLVKGSATAAASNELVTQALRELVDAKKKRPGRDLASELIAHPSALTDDEIIEHLRLILVAAHQGTVNLLAHTLRLVLTDPRFRGSLSGAQMTLPDALDQVLWDTPPIAAVPGRWATGDTRLGGQQIREGDMLLLCPAAGNADPEVRAAEAPMHGNRSHLAFSFGPHQCPGADIGRAIAETGIDTLLSLLPDVRLAVLESELSIEAAWLTQRPAALPVAFEPRQVDAGR